MINRILTYMAFAVVAFASFHTGERYAIGVHGKEILVLAQEVCTYYQGQAFVPVSGEKKNERYFHNGITRIASNELR